jgi:hypothetical protein
MDKKRIVDLRGIYWSEMDSVHDLFVVGDLSPPYAADPLKREIAATTNVVPMHPFDFRSV